MLKQVQHDVEGNWNTLNCEEISLHIDTDNSDGSAEGKCTAFG